MNYTLQLQPGQTQPVNRSGDFFALVFAPTDVFVKLPGSEEVLYGQGDSLTLPPGEQFSRLEVRNPTTRAITVTVYAGTGRYEQRRQSVVEPETILRGSAGTLAPGDTVDVSGAPQSGEIRRKLVVLTNGSSEGRLQVVDSAGAVVVQIFPEQNLALPVSGACRLRNSTALAIEYNVAHFYWAV